MLAADAQHSSIVLERTLLKLHSQRLKVHGALIPLIFMITTDKGRAKGGYCEILSPLQ